MAHRGTRLVGLIALFAAGATPASTVDRIEESVPPALVSGPIRHAPSPESGAVLEVLPPAFAQVVIALCAGDPSMRARYVEGIRAYLKTPPPEEQLRRDVYADWLKAHCDGPAMDGFYAEQEAAHEGSHPLVARYFEGLKDSFHGKRDPVATGGLDWAVTLWKFDAAQWIGESKARRQELRKASQNCVRKERKRGGDGLSLLRCLKAFATVDWAAAKKEARGVEVNFGNKPGERLADYDISVVTALARFESRDKAREYSVQIGLVSALPEVLTEGEFLPLDVLRRSGRYVYDYDDLATPAIEARYGLVLARLRLAAREWLEGAVCADGTVGDVAGGGAQAVTLSCWMDGERFSVRGRTRGGRWRSEIELPHRMVNALLEARNAPVRVIRVGIDELVVAPKAAVQKAAADRLIELGEPIQ